MEIRRATSRDLPAIEEIDGTVESQRYLHIERTGEGMQMAWRIEERLLRQRLIEPFRLDDSRRLALRQIVEGMDEGIALVAEYESELVALGLAQLNPETSVLHILDVRVDSDHRRQGLASGIVFQMVQDARARSCRAISAQTTANNFPANQMFSHLSFDLAGLDTCHRSNHDLVKESVTLFWYAALD
jgi:GNAT superfamily N-acetyltransferase